MTQPGIKIPNENPSLQKENDECKKIQELSVERGKKLKEQQEELEKMHKELEKYKKDNNTLRKKADEKDDSIRELQKKLDHYQRLKFERNRILSRLSSVAGARQNIHFPEIDIADQSNDNRSEENVSILSKDNKNFQDPKLQAAEEKIQSLQTENSSLISALAKKSTEIDDLWNKCTNLQKYKSDTELEIRTLLIAVEKKETEIETLHKHLVRNNYEFLNDVSNLKEEKENAEDQRQNFSKALDEKEKEIEIMRNDIARYEQKISTLTKTVEDIKGSKNQAADEKIKGLQKKIGSLESELRNATTEMNDLSYNYKCLQKDKESAEYTINKLSRNVQEKEKEIDSLIEDLAKANENEYREEHAASANSIQKLTDENASLKSKLSQLSHDYEQLRKDYNEVKREKDHAFNSSVAEEKLRNNNPGIADLSDENRPTNLGEKFSQLYDDQWTDAIKHLQEMGYSETDGIRRLLYILKAVFGECVRLSDIHFNQLKELTGTSHLPSDQLKKLKDLRKATAVHSVAKIKQVVNDYMSTAFSKEKAACQTYIDRSIELCWLMSVHDPPVVIDFIAVHGQAIDDKILRKFTKTGSKIDFLVWPVIRLHRNGPLLQKGVVQPI